jgi:hypothetical protein
VIPYKINTNYYGECHIGSSDRALPHKLSENA